MLKKEIYEEVHNLEELCVKMCTDIWNHPEVGGTEVYSCNYMKEVMKKEGFSIVEEEKVPHSFYAEYGSGKPVIAILGEYDALPALSQMVCAVQAPIQVGGPGHGCGHNLLGSAAATAAIAVKRFLEQEKIEGTVRFYGCPEEELLCGKVKMIYYHMFENCDMALSWHPMDLTAAYDKAYLASASAHFKFKGKSAHAAFAPHLGRSALDAVELMNVGANYMREHVIDSARIHYTTDSGGYSPNIVPDKAGSWYFARAPRITDVKDIMNRLGKIAEGAALMTETESEMKIDYGCCEYHGIRSYADLTHQNILEAPKPVYTEEELQFAKDIQATLKPADLANKRRQYGQENGVMFDGPADRELAGRVPMNASSDSGDVSYLMPMNLFTTHAYPIGVAPHTWQSCALAGHSVGQKGAIYAANIIAGTCYDLFTQPEICEQIIADFKACEDYYQPMYEE